jgi:hypothetical protein
MSFPRYVRAAALMLLLPALPPARAAGCQPPREVVAAAPADVVDFFARDGRTVLTFAGYSGAGYEDEAAMLRHAARVLKPLDPARTIVNIGATAAGIGAVYALAKRRGFATTGIVSMQARRAAAELSPCVDLVFYVDDESWGGYLPGTGTLSPTSTAMVAVSARMVAIGGGEVARDELLAAKALGKPVTFIAADMNHVAAVKQAAGRGQPLPTDFRGAAHEAVAAQAAPSR